MVLGFLADRQQVVVSDRVNVEAEAGDLYLAEHGGCRWRLHVDHEKRIELLERDDITPILNEPNRVNTLLLDEVQDPTDLLEGCVDLLENEYVVGELLHRPHFIVVGILLPPYLPLRRGYPQVA